MSFDIPVSTKLCNGAMACCSPPWTQSSCRDWQLARMLISYRQSGGQQVFDAREESSKTKECALIWDEESQVSIATQAVPYLISSTMQSFPLHLLSTTLNLTLNRNASNATRVPNTAAASRSPSAASTASSVSVPLHKRKHREPDEERDSHSSGDVRLEVSSMIGEPEDTPKAKKARSSEGVSAASAPRPTKGGKTLPRKMPAAPEVPSSAPTPVKAIKANKNGKKAGKAPKKTAKAPPTPQGKYKSAETIEDSDEEYGLDEGGAHDEGEVEEDEFAKMVGESLAMEQTSGQYPAAEEDSSDEEEEDDEEAEMGGARLVGRDQRKSQSSRYPGSLSVPATDMGTV